MRIIDEESAQAFINREKYKNGNTVCKDEADWGFTMSLHNSRIAQYIDGRFFLSDAGWLTRTTKARLNGILTALRTPYCIYQRNGDWYFNDRSSNISVPFPDTQWNSLDELIIAVNKLRTYA